MSTDNTSRSAEQLSSSSVSGQDVESPRISPSRFPEADREVSSTGQQAQSSKQRRKRQIVSLEKRRRVQKACNTCRRNKMKCNGQTPCIRCIAARKDCRYSESESSQRCISTGPSGTENEKLYLLDNIFRQLHPDIPTDLQSLKDYAVGLNGPITECNDSHTSEDCRASDPARDKGGNFNKDIEIFQGDSILLGGTSEPPTIIKVHNQGKTHLDGGSSHWAFFDSVFEAVTGDDELIPPNRIETNYQHFVSDALNFSTKSNHRDKFLPALPPREVVDFLVSTFFQYAQANFFYVHPEIFSRKLKAFYAGLQEFEGCTISDSRKSAEFICLLFMVLAIGSQFAHLEPDTQEPLHDNKLLDPPLMLEISNLEVPERSPNPGWRFYEIAQSLLSDVVFSSSMTSIQACVLQGTFLLSTNARDVSYNVLGLALRMAVNMGMHRSVSSESLHPHTRELRNRLWWSVYIAERLFSVEMGRPLAIDDTEIDAPFPVNIPELNTIGTNNFVGQIAMIKLCQIMGKIVKLMYPHQTLSKNGKEIDARLFAQLRKELNLWKTTLPDSLRLSGKSSRAVAHLHLTYEQAIILLTRTCLNHAIIDIRISPLSKASRKFVVRNASNCVSAARTCIQILSALRARSLLSCFSFHDFLYCSSALYVLLLGVKLESPTTLFKSTILQGISVLYELAKGSEAAASSLQFISRSFQSFLRAPSSTLTGSTEGYGRLRGRKAWQAWAERSRPQSVSNKDSMSASHQATEEFTQLDDTELIGSAQCRGQTEDRLQYKGQRRNRGSSNIAEWALETEPAEKSSLPGVSPESLDVQTFWLPSLETNFDLLGRDLTDPPSLESLNYQDFLSFEPRDNLN